MGDCNHGDKYGRAGSSGSFLLTSHSMQYMQDQNIEQNFVVKVLVDMLLIVLLAVPVYGLFFFIARLTSPGIVIYWNEVLTNTVFAFTVVEVIYYAHNYLNAERRAEKALREELQYKYNMLRLQVNPHFLFNSLNTLYSLVSTDVRRSEAFIEALSGLYRYVLECQNKDTVRLRDELANLRRYVDILRMRYGDQLSVEVSGEENASGRRIVPLTLQLLIENVTKHNIVSEKYPMEVNVVISPDDIVVRNAVRKRVRNGEYSSGIGLDNISGQYGLHDKKIKIEDDGVIFAVTVPHL